MSSAPLVSGAALAVAFATSACCTNGTYDPREGGFAGGACGVATGSYDARVVQRERTIQDLQSIGDRMLASIDRDLDETAMLDRRIANLRDRYESFAAKLAILKERDAEEGDLRDEIFVLQERAAQLERRMNRMPQPSPEEPADDPAMAKAVILAEAPDLPSPTLDEMEDAEAFMDSLDAEAAELLAEPTT